MNKRTIESLLIPVSFLLFTLWYMRDTVKISMDAHNTLYVLPLGTLLACVLLSILIKEIVSHKKHSTDEAGVLCQDLRHTFLCMALFALFIISLEYVGYDIATFVFMCLSLHLFGEKRLHYIFLYSFTFCLAVLIFFSLMLPYPIPTMFGVLMGT